MFRVGLGSIIIYVRLRVTDVRSRSDPIAGRIKGSREDVWAGLVDPSRLGAR